MLRELPTQLLSSPEAPAPLAVRTASSTGFLNFQIEKKKKDVSW